jgi:hypothetical protein
MNSADLERAWRSPRNSVDPAALATARDQLFAGLKKRHRARRLFLALVLGALTLLSVRVALATLPRGGGPAIDPGRDWASLVFLALPWIGFAVLTRQMRRHERGPRQAAETIGDTVRALLAENTTARAGLRVTAGLLGATVLLLPLVVGQLRATGKAGDEILWPAFLGWPLIAGAILAALWWQDRHRLLPRRRHLEALRQELEERAD